MDQVMAKNDTKLGILFMIGATIVVGAGLFTFLRARQLARRT